VHNTWRWQRPAELVRDKALRFAAVGVVNTLIGLAAIYAGLAWLGMGDATANLFGYCIGWSVSFPLNRRFTFRHRGNVGLSLLRFLLVSALAYAANLGLVLFVHRVLMVNVYVAQLFGVGTYTLVAFLGSYYYVFPHTREVNSSRG
jgi:putative flippase GtrA